MLPLHTGLRLTAIALACLVLPSIAVRPALALQAPGEATRPEAGGDDVPNQPAPPAGEPGEPGETNQAEPAEATATEPDAAPPTEPAAPELLDPEAKAERMLAEGEAEKAAEQSRRNAAAGQRVEEQIDLLNLMMAGKWLMLPILLMSFVVVMFGVERALALRRGKVLPPALIAGLSELAEQKGGLDPRRAYKLCQQHPSTAARVVKAMLLKVGRPHTELEQAVSDARDREATRLDANVRWLTLAAGVTPLMGLLGTVWGMIQAFFVTARLPTGANKAEALAEGIYMALVTTFAGLAVAIPAAILAHLLEGRIQKLLLQLEETLLGLMPQLERFEGRTRVTREAPGARRPQGDAHEPAGDNGSRRDEAPSQSTSESTTRSRSADPAPRAASPK